MCGSLEGIYGFLKVRSHKTPMEAGFPGSSVDPRLSALPRGRAMALAKQPGGDLHAPQPGWVAPEMAATWERGPLLLSVLSFQGTLRL